MAKYAPKWARLPSESGVTFEGFENVKLESREKAQKKLEEFLELAVNANATHARFLIAEWGEGKTDAYQRYIKPYCDKKNLYTTLLTAKQISNNYENLKQSSLFKQIIDDAHRLIFAILLSIESRDQMVIDLDTIKDPKKYIIDKLRQLTSNNLSKRLFLFVDEFEDLFLTNEEFLETFLLAIKGLINKNSILNVDGINILGNIHFIICCTPNIFSRIKTRYETIWGGLSRRVHEISLPQVPRSEGLRFLFELLKYSYNNDLPEILPIETEGVLSTLHLVSLGNLGTMVQLFARLLGTATITNNNEIEKISYDKLIEFLKPEKIAIYGGETPAINNEAFSKFLDLTKKALRSYPPQTHRIFPLLVGEWKPFMIEEIKERIGYKHELTRVINSLKLFFNRENFPKPIIEVKLFNNIDDIKDLFGDFYKKDIDGDKIDFGNNIFEFREILDKITHATIEQDELKLIYAFPSEEEGIKALFDNIDEGSLRILKMRLHSYDNSEIYYMINPKILQQIYPTPIPVDLNYIRDRQKRLKLWRDITIRYQEEFYKLPQHLIQILRKHPNFEIIRRIPTKSPTLKNSRNVLLAELKYSTGSIKYEYNALLYITSEFVKEDYEKLIKILNEERTIHQIWILSSQVVSEDYKLKLNELEEIRSKILYLHISITIGKKLCLLGDVIISSDVKKDEEKLQDTVNRLLDDLEIISKIQKCINEMDKEGWIINDFTLKLRNKNDLIKGFRFFLNMKKDQMKISDAFKINREKLMKYTLYGGRMGFFPDIESEDRLLDIAQDLADNNFGKLIENEIFIISEHPIEKKILYLIKQTRSMPVKNLQKCFVYIARDKGILDDFLDILIYKGYIERAHDTIKWITVSELQDKWDQLREKINELSKKYINKRFETILVAKEREERSYTLKEFINFLSDLRDEFDLTENERFQRQIYRITDRYIEYFEKQMSVLISKAEAEGKTCIEEEKKRVKEFEQEYLSLKEMFNTNLNLSVFSENEATEYIEIQEFDKKFHALVSLEPPKLIEKLKNIADYKRYFSFRNKTFPYFNVRLYLLTEAYNALNQSIEKAQTRIGELKRNLESVTQQKRRILQGLRSIRIEKTHKICNILKNKLVSAIQSIKIPDVTFDTITSIEELNEYLVSISSNYSMAIVNFSRSVNKLEAMLPKERKFLSHLNILRGLLKQGEIMLDTEEAKCDFEAIKSCFNELLLEYAEKVTEAENFVDLDKINDFIDEVDEVMKTISGKLFDMPDKLNGIVINKVNEVKLFLESIQTNWRRLKDSVEISMPDEYYKLKDKISKYKELTDLKYAFSEIDEYKRIVQESFYSQVTKKWDNRTLLILEIINKITAINSSKTFDENLIYEVMKEKDCNISLSKEEICGILERLCKEGYLQRKYSLLS